MISSRQGPSQESDSAALWEELRREIARRISQHEYLTWFREVSFRLIDPAQVALFVPNAFYQSYMRHRFQAVLQEAVEAVLNSGSTSLTIQVEQQTSAPAVEAAAQTTPPARKPQRPTAQSTVALQLPENLSLNPCYTFEEFVIGPSNRLAHAAAKSVAAQPGCAYNPLFIYGQVGLGKTHLMQAVAHEYLRSHQRNIAYISCASFTNDFISAVGSNKIEAFRDKYRRASALLIDDIHFLADKERTQEEFFHTFNAIYNQQRQIYLSSDSLPSDIQGLSERLVSRFKLGLVTQLSPPGFETRVAILTRKARNLGLKLPPEIAEYVAQLIRENIRELEGAVKRMHTIVTIEKEQLTPATVRAALSDTLPAALPHLDLHRIQRVILQRFSITPSELHSRSRTRSIVLPRQLCMYLARSHTDLSLSEIGRFFGGRDHTTVLHSCDKIRRLVSSDQQLRATLREIERQLGI